MLVMVTVTQLLSRRQQTQVVIRKNATRYTLALRDMPAKTVIVNRCQENAIVFALFLPAVLRFAGRSQALEKMAILEAGNKLQTKEYLLRIKALAF
jgi:hypothetical protein